jgi:integrase
MWGIVWGIALLVAQTDGSIWPHYYSLKRLSEDPKRSKAMPSMKRHKTKYPGVFYVDGTDPATGKHERIYYIRYRQAGKLVEEKAGRQRRDKMTPTKAAGLRAKRMGGALTNRELRAEEKKKLEAKEERWTIRRLWAEYKRQHPDLKGLVTDENRFQLHIDPRFGAHEPHELSPMDIDRLRLSLLKTRAPATVRNVLELLRRIINFGLKKNLCEGPPFKLELPRTNNIKTEDLTPEQLQALLDAIEDCSNVQVGNLMKMALLTGMRRGELFRLKWEDIDFQRGFIHIRSPKGGHDQMVPLNESAKALLRDHPRVEGSGYVFPGRNGRQRVDCTKQVNKIKKAAELPKDFRALHGLRHVFASTLASSGQVDMYTLQKLLTHKSPSMTQRYAHLHDDALRAASEVAGDLVGLQNGSWGKSRKLKMG